MALEVMEAVVKALIQEDPEMFSIALNNVCAFGDVFDEADYYCTDVQLSRLFDGIDIINEVMKEIPEY